MTKDWVQGVGHSPVCQILLQIVVRAAGADVVLNQSCMPNSVEGLLEVYEDMVEVLLVLEIFLTEDS